MRKAFFLLFLSTFFLISNNGFKIIQADANGVILEYQFSGFHKKTVQIGNKTYFQIWSENTVPVLNAGFPEILRDAISLAVPDNCKPEIEVLQKDFYIENNLPLAPSKGSLKRNVDPKNVPFTFASVYNSNAFYPSLNYSIDQHYNFRNVNGISLSIYPVRYNPVDNQAEILRKLVIKVNFFGKNKKLKYLEIPEYHSMEEKFILEDRFANLSFLNSNGKTQYTPLSEYGDMLIISAPTLTAEMIPLINWKNQKGIRTQMVTTAVTGTSQSSIKAYIANQYSLNPNLIYVLLVGDHQNITAYNDGMAGTETKWSDSKYGMITGGTNDYYPELMVGRFSSTLTTDIQTMVNRTLEYEKNPQAGTWFTKGIGIGSNEGYGIGDDGEPDWLHIRNIGIKLVNGAGYTYIHEFFDSTHGGNDAPGDPTSAMVQSAVNTGASIFLYAGHGSQSSCVTSNFNISAINSCTNNGRYPFSVQVACNNGTFHNGTCFSEAFIRAKNSQGPTGAIASCGSSILMAWAEPMETQDEIGDIISNQYPNNKKYTLGGLFYCGQMKMLDKYPTNTGREVMATWVMFGDPSCMFRCANPTTLAVQHATCIAPQATSFNVQVNPGPGTYVCLSQNNQILGRTLVTSLNTSIAITQTFSISQPILITVTEYNKLPYQATLTICTGTTTELPHYSENKYVTYNTLVKDELKIQSFELIESLIITDLSGKMILKAEKINTHDFSMDLRELNENVYLLTVITSQNTHKGKIIKKLN
ncbi:MAG: C25 family cysteine peptidase [Bacteroidia bacterium]|nr:C25 family cysteine peptidase [Bacteroidia bacterium]